MDKIFYYFDTLWQVFGWYSLAFVAVTFFLMIPVNLLLCHIFAAIGAKKERTAEQQAGMDRTRKTLSSLSVFAVAALIITLFSLWRRDVITAGYVFSNSLLVAPLAMAMRAVYKLLRDKGVMPLLTALAGSKEFKRLLEGIDLDDSVKAAVCKYIDNYLDKTPGDAANIIIENETALADDIANKLTGFAENALDAARKVLEAYKKKYIAS